MTPRRIARSVASLKRLSPLVHPVLLATYPVLTLFQRNQSEVALSVLRNPLVISAATGGALFVLCGLVVRRERKAGVLATLIVLAFFYYGIFRGDVGLHDGVFF